MNEELKTLLKDELGCSDGFVKRAEELRVKTVPFLVMVILGPHHDRELDFFQLLNYFHEEVDDADPSANFHTFKSDLLIIFSFGFVIKHSIMPN